MTVSQIVKDYLSNRNSETEDAEFEIVEPLQLPNSEPNPEECDATDDAMKN